MTRAIAERYFGGDYVLELASLGNHGLVSLTSGSSLQLLPYDASLISNTQPSFQVTVKDGVDAIRAVEGSTFACCGASGVQIWDVRMASDKPSQSFRSPNGSRLLCLDAKEHIVAAGSEVLGQDASVFFWDLRSSKNVLSYVDSHSEDVTQVQFHPSDKNGMLSGSVDGLINIYDTSIADEDDAVYQTINHGSSLHRAMFIGDKQVLALSHDEKLSIYHITDPDREESVVAPIEFGDIREKWQCQYVCDVLDKYIAIGANTTSEFSLVPFFDGRVDLSNKIPLEHAHGEEVVRTVYIHPTSGVVYTGGEDSMVKVWKPDGIATSNDKHKQKEKHKHKHKDKHQKEKKSLKLKTEKSKTKPLYKPY